MSIHDLPEWVRPGASFRYEYGPDNHNTGRKFHVRGIVDGQAVVREWWSSKQRWNYEVQHPAYFDAFKDAIVIVKRAPPETNMRWSSFDDWWLHHLREADDITVLECVKKAFEAGRSAPPQTREPAP